MFPSKSLPPGFTVRSTLVLSVAALLVGISAGCASALFLWLLASVTALRGELPWIVFMLPVGGAATGLAYARWGRPVAGGVELVLDRSVEGGEKLPLRMAPLVLIGTVLTHLMGGSAGREGTAVQMGAALSDQVAFKLGLSPDQRKRLLRAGVAAGFSSAFGTPLAGAIFGLEFSHKRLRPTLEGAFTALIAAYVGNWVSIQLYDGHAAYPRLPPLEWHPNLFAGWLLLAVAIAACVRVFVHGKGLLADKLTHYIPTLAWRMAAGGAIVVALWQLVGRDDYLGLGVPQILSAFEGPGNPLDFAWKLLFTIVTLAAGFLGGEVTPLFFIGATLGNSLAGALSLSIPHFAGVGLAATFAAAAGTPLALSVMAGELFGWAIVPHVFFVAMIARYARGERSIYGNQRDL